MYPVLTEKVHGRAFSFSDHFALRSTFTIIQAKKTPPKASQSSPSTSGANFTPLIPLMSPDALTDTTTTFAPIDPPRSPSSPLSSRTSIASSAKSTCVRSAINTLRMYARISQRTARSHLRLFYTAVICLVGLTVGSGFQPKSYLQPIFTLLAGAMGAGGATMLFTGFIWGRWEEGLLKEVIEEMELELRVVEMEERAGRT